MFGFNEAMLSFLRRQVGLRTDAADPAGSLHAKIKNIMTSGCDERQAIASSTVRLSADTTKTTTSTSYVLMKKIVVFRTGIYRVSFRMRNNNGIGGGKARIYRNGTPYGTERVGTNGATVTYTEDLPFSKGDTIEVWALSNSSYSTYISNFKIAFDLATTPTDGVVILD